MTLADVVRLVAGLSVVGGLSAALAWAAGVAVRWQPLSALARAALQLAVIAVLMRGVLTSPWLVAAFVALMASIASWTSGHRLREMWEGRRTAVLGVVAGAATALSLVFALGLVAWQGRYVLATAGIVIGNAMNAVTLAGRRLMIAMRERRDEIEGWLALGATPARAHLDLGRQAAYEAVLPNLDQTRATGLVTLPGAFVGALFGGASPVRAAEFQLVVLAAVGLAMLVTAVVVTRLLGRTPYVAAEEAGLRPS